MSVNTSMPPHRKPSLHIRATASSTRAPIKAISYEARNVLDGNWRTGWVEGGSGAGLGEWIQCDFDREATLQRIIVTPGYFKSAKLWAENNRLSAATFYFSDGSSRKFHFPDRMEAQKLEVGNVKTTWVKMVLDEIYLGSVYPDDTPISDMSFDWVD